MISKRTTIVAALLLAAQALPLTTRAAEPAPVCDRTCLNGYVDRYIDAMIRHDTTAALFSRDLRFTENGIRLPFGTEGGWHLTTARGTYSFYVPDTETQQVAFLGTLRERGRTPQDQRVVGFSLRLKIRGGLITEVEQLVARPATNLFAGSSGAPATPFGNTGDNVEKMGAPNARFAADIPANERASREDLVRTANAYFTGLQGNDGKGYYPFTDDCIRFENGMDVLASS